MSWTMSPGPTLPWMVFFFFIQILYTKMDTVSIIHEAKGSRLWSSSFFLSCMCCRSWRTIANKKSSVLLNLLSEWKFLKFYPTNIRNEKQTDCVTRRLKGKRVSSFIHKYLTQKKWGKSLYEEGSVCVTFILKVQKSIFIFILKMHK